MFVASKNLRLLLVVLTIAGFSSFAWATDPITYEYDSLNRLIRIAYPGGTVIEYTYDAAGNRLTRVVRDLLSPGPVVSIDDVEVTEGNSGTTDMVFTVSLSESSSEVVTVDYLSTDETAEAGSDYIAAAGTVSFDVGTTTQTITVQVQGDVGKEEDETFLLRLVGCTYATIGDAEGLGSISEDDWPSVAFVQGASSDAESVTPATIEVALSMSWGEEVTVDYAVSDGTATGGGTDYSLAGGTLTFPAGVTSQDVPLTVVNDTFDEPDETVEITLSNPVEAWLGATAVHTYTVVDDDEPPGVSSVAPSVNSVSVSRDSTIFSTFNMEMNAGTETTFLIHGAMTGRLGGAYGGQSTATLDFSPSGELKPGELVEVTLTTGLTGTGAIPIATPYVWRFLAAAGTGPAVFDAVSRNVGTGGTDTRAVALADMDGDGDLDLVVGNDGEQNRVLLNNGSGAFTDGTLGFGTGSDATHALVLGDVDGDGDPDVAVGNFFQQNRVYLNDGAGNLTDGTMDFGTGADATYSLDIGDLDGDGDLDLAVANFFQQNKVYLNDGTGDFSTAERDFGTGNDRSYAVGLGDLDEDGDLDLAVGNDFEQNLVYLNDGDGDFTGGPWSFGTGDERTRALALGDVDGDGAADIVVGNEGGANAVYLNQGSGAWNAAASPGSGSESTWALALADVDGDGDLDLATANFGQQNVVYLNDGAGSFTDGDRNLGTGTGASFSVALGDVNQDGDIDLAVGNYNQQNLVLPNAPAPELQFSVSSYEVGEGDANAIITVTRTGSYETDVGVSYATSNDTATAGNDYTSTSGTLTFLDEDTSDQTFLVPITDDVLYEGNETVNLSLSNPTGGATLGTPAIAVLTITENDPLPSVSVDDIAVFEGDSGTVNAVFTATLSHPSVQTVSVAYDTADGSATTADSDYVADSDTITFSPGTTTQTITIQVTGDTTIEGDEGFAVNLSNATNGTIADSQGLCTIIEDDCTFVLSPASVSLGPSAGSYDFSVTASGLCEWTPSTGSGWITIDSGAGPGNGTVSYSVTENTDYSERADTITVGDQVFSVTQSGAPPPGPSGDEFQANTYAPGNQDTSAVASDADGNFVVVWASELEDGSGRGVFGQRFAYDGSVLGDEFQVNTHTTLDQLNPSVAMDTDGDFAVVWESVGQDGDSSGIFSQRYSNDGTLVGLEFQVNTFTTSYQSWPLVAMDAGGDFVVVWNGYTDGSYQGVFAQVFSSDGTPSGSELVVNTYTTGIQTSHSVAMDAGGDFVVVWQSYDGNYDVFGQRFANDGSLVGGEFQVNTETEGASPTVAMNEEGAFVVVWDRWQALGDGLSVFGQRFANDGSAVGGEFQVNTYVEGDQWAPFVAMDGDGDFVVSWNSEGEDGSADGAFAQRFSKDGSPVGDAFQVNVFTTDAQTFPSVAMDAGGDFVVVWDSLDQDGSGYGVFGRQFTMEVPRDEMVADFGSRGLWHYDGADWTSPTRWDSLAIMSWQDRLVVVFDEGRGLWKWDSAGWAKISGWQPYELEAWGDNLVAAFDAGRGLWLYDSSSWSKLTSWEPEQMVACGNNLVIDFGSTRGVWLYESSVWSKISSWDPYDLVAWGDKVAAAFDSGRGLWLYDSPDWTKLTSWEPEQVVAWRDKLVADFGATKGLQVYGSSSWKQISAWSSTDIICWKGKLAAVFDSGRGLWLYDTSSWSKLTNWEPTHMETLADKLVAGFGSGRGIYIYDSAWIKITGWDSEDMEAVDLF